MNQVNKIFDKKRVMITGGTGSFGQEFVRTILSNSVPDRVIVFSRDELKQFEMQNQPEFRAKSDKLRFFLGDVRDAQRLNLAMASGVDFVIHAAALKQVPAVEYNPFEAIKTNILGSQNVIDAALYNGVDRVIALSTDKAAAPINLYGASKLAADKLFQAANNYTGFRKTRFSVVRYGNVMGSRGSVIPLFLRQRDSGVISITDERMTRFSITLNEGVDFVINSLGRMSGGEIFVPKIPSYRITDVALAVAPGARQNFIGVRPGEKLHEQMITKGDCSLTVEYPHSYVILPSILSSTEVRDFCDSSEGKLVDDQGVAGEFSYSSDTNDWFLTVEEIRALISGHK